MTNALMVRGDGRPGLTVDPSCVNTIREFEGYCWKKGKDEPVKEGDHAMDALRYALFSMRRGKLLFGPITDVVAALDKAAGIKPKAKAGDGSREPGPHVVEQPLVAEPVAAAIEAAGPAEAFDRTYDDDSAWS